MRGGTLAPVPAASELGPLLLDTTIEFPAPHQTQTQQKEQAERRQLAPRFISADTETLAQTQRLKSLIFHSIFNYVDYLCWFERLRWNRVGWIGIGAMNWRWEKRKEGGGWVVQPERGVLEAGAGRREPVSRLLKPCRWFDGTGSIVCFGFILDASLFPIYYSIQLVQQVFRILKFKNWGSFIIFGSFLGHF